MNYKPKYRAQKVIIDGLKFDSKKEARRYTELKLLEKAGEIKNLETQRKFELIPAQRIGGKVVERACNYVADFVYFESSTGAVVVEDVKSPATRTPQYIIKRKLLLKNYGLRIREI